MIVDLMKQRVAPNSQICLLLKNGQEEAGVIVEIGDSYITLQTSKGEIVVVGDLIGGWRVFDAPAQSVSASVLPKPPSNSHPYVATAVSSSPQGNEAPVSGHQSASPTLISDSHNKPSASNSSSQLDRQRGNLLEQIVQSVATLIERTKLDALPPEFPSIKRKGNKFASWSQLQNVEKEWNKFRDRYHYAIKIQDHSRLVQIAQEMSEFIEQYPDLVDGPMTLGSLYLMLNRPERAVTVLEKILLSHPDTRTLYHNLAVACYRNQDKAGAFEALVRVFQQSAPSTNSDCWYSLVAFAVQFRQIDPLTACLKLAVADERQEDARLVLRSLAYFLEYHSWTDEALEILDFTQEVGSNDRLLLAFIEKVSSRVNASQTSLVLQKQARELTAVRTRWQEAENLGQRRSEIAQELSTAKILGDQGKYKEAAVVANRALVLDSGNNAAKHLYDTYSRLASTTRPATVKKPVTNAKSGPLPAGKGPYAEAKRAYMEDRDYQKAEALFRKAIQQNDSPESAVKDLASLLQQQGRSDEAVQLLAGFLPKAGDRLKILNLIANIHQHANRYHDAIVTWYKILDMVSFDRRVNVLKQIGYCQFKLNDFDEAEQTLQQVLMLSPQDLVARKWLDGLRHAKLTGDFERLDDIFIDQDLLIGVTSSISKFLEFYLGRSEYQGVAEAKIATRSFTEEDLTKLRGLIDGAGRKRPGLRAQYNLSSAKLLMDLDSEDDQMLRQYLVAYAADMGNASLAEQKHRDVALAYYMEALAVTSHWRPKQTEVLSQLLMLFYSDQDAILSEKLPSIEVCLRQAFKQQQNSQRVLEILLEISLLNSSAAEYLLKRIHRDKALLKKVHSLCCTLLGMATESTEDFAGFAKSWRLSRDSISRRRQEVADELIYLQSVACPPAPVEDQIARVQQLEQKSRHTLDGQRLRSISAILGHAFDYVQQQSYVERERWATIIERRIQELVEEIEESPTRYSLEMYRPYLLHLSKSVSEHFARIQQAAEPDQLQCTLSVDSYVPGPDGSIPCAITVSNPTGKSPASAILIEVRTSPNEEYTIQQSSIPVTEALPGGTSITREVPVTVTNQAINAQVFTLHYHLTYKTRTGREIRIGNQTLPIRLYPVSEFQEIANPYAAYAEGGAVRDEGMFYGRGQLLENLLSTIRNAPTNKSLIIYGQKRTGKSSILYHLKKRLELPFIPVLFSVGDFIADFSVAAFLYRIIQSLEDEFEDLSEQGYPIVAVDRPTLTELDHNPQLVFIDYMKTLSRALSRTSQYRDARLLLLVDEFSYIYGEVVRGSVPATFMKSWKALLEIGYFGSVLVGQDIMRQFMEKFPNEFQVAQSERVSYLAPDDARDLMVNPIRIPESQESRYRGAALERLSALTAGNPFYIQIFCARLVQYMNRKRAIYITDADIDRVKEELIRGPNSLTIDHFDNLINAGDSGDDAIPDKDTLAVLRRIAVGSRTQTYCSISDISCIASVPIEDVLNDLVRRDVLEKQGPSLFRIRVELFKDWLLANQ